MSLVGQLFAKRMVIETQQKISRVHRQYTREIKNISQNLKAFKLSKKSFINGLKAQASAMNQSIFRAARAGNLETLAPDLAKMGINLADYQATLAELQGGDATTKQTAYQVMSSLQAEVANAYAQQTNVIESTFELEEQMMEEEKADKEEEMQTEEATLKAELETYQGIAKTEEEFNKQNRKDMFGQ